MCVRTHTTMRDLDTIMRSLKLYIFHAYSIDVYYSKQDESDNIKSVKKKEE